MRPQRPDPSPSPEAEKPGRSGPDRTGTIVEVIDEKTLFIRPAWAIDLEHPEREPRARRRKKRGSRLLSHVAFEIKAAVVILIAVGGGLLLIRGLYIAKSAAGIDLIPGVHGPDVAPFLK